MGAVNHEFIREIQSMHSEMSLKCRCLPNTKLLLQADLEFLFIQQLLHFVPLLKLDFQPESEINKSLATCKRDSEIPMTERIANQDSCIYLPWLL